MISFVPDPSLSPVFGVLDPRRPDAFLAAALKRHRVRAGSLANQLVTLPSSARLSLLEALFAEGDDELLVAILHSPPLSQVGPENWCSGPYVAFLHSVGVVDLTSPLAGKHADQRPDHLAVAAAFWLEFSLLAVERLTRRGLVLDSVVYALLRAPVAFSYQFEVQGLWTPDGPVCSPPSEIQRFHQSLSSPGSSSPRAQIPWLVYRLWSVYGLAAPPPLLWPVPSLLPCFTAASGPRLPLGEPLEICLGELAGFLASSTKEDLVSLLSQFPSLLPWALAHCPAAADPSFLPHLAPQSTAWAAAPLFAFLSNPASHAGAFQSVAVDALRSRLLPSSPAPGTITHLRPVFLAAASLGLTFSPADLAPLADLAPQLAVTSDLPRLGLVALVREACMDPSIRPHLLSVPPGPLWAGVMVYSRGLEWLEIARALCDDRAAASEYVHALRMSSAWNVEGLSRSSLLFLVSHSSPSVRREATALMLSAAA